LSLQSYEKALKAHLDEYRRGRLGGVESGILLANGVERPYGHILPTKLQWLNILEPFRAEVMQYQISNALRLHPYFHHLNSSQAFAFNLFIPLFQHAAEKLAKVLSTPAVFNWSNAQIRMSAHRLTCNGVSTNGPASFAK
jgi:hypothetical protein